VDDAAADHGSDELAAVATRDVGVEREDVSEQRQAPDGDGDDRIPSAAAHEQSVARSSERGQGVSFDAESLLLDRDGLPFDRDGLELEGEAIQFDAEDLCFDGARLPPEGEALFVEAEGPFVEPQCLFVEPQCLWVEAQAVSVEAQCVSVEREARSVEGQVVLVVPEGLRVHRAALSDDLEAGSVHRPSPTDLGEGVSASLALASTAHKARR
jgi:hypothetical protein